MSAIPGDTLASALLANGVSLFGRSFKYHRPRGVLAAGIDEPNALVTVLKGDIREPNIPATLLEIHDGLTVVSQNRFPSLAFDVGAVNQLAGKLISAGFYYKTFMGPVVGPLRGTRFWMLCEHVIRRAAGLGRAGYARDSARYERMNAFCDVLVVGSGPAGLMAARAAAERGQRVILAELDSCFGGTANWSDETIDGMPAAEWATRAVEELSRRGNVRLLNRTTVWGYYDGNVLAAIERVADHRSIAGKGEPRHRHWSIRAGAVVLGTGAFERPLVFPGNDRPGVMLAGAAERYANEFGVVVGDKAVVFTNNDSAYRAAAALVKAGGGVTTIVDVRADISPARAQPCRRRQRGTADRPCDRRDRRRPGGVGRQGAAIRCCGARAVWRHTRHRRRQRACLGWLVAGDPSGQPGGRQAALERRGASLCAAGAHPELDRRRCLPGSLLHR